MSTLQTPEVSRSRRQRLLLGIGVGSVLLLATFAYHAAFGAYFMLDDFGLLTIVRQFGNPLEPFYREHIPGGLYYRPIGMLFWWLSQQLFAASPGWHYLANLGLLLASAGLLWALVERCLDSRLAGVAVALAFAVHPIAIGTSLWLADRFDLLALVFGLLGLMAMLDYSRSGKWRALLLAVAGFALALLSKEIALAVIAAATVLCLSGEGGMDRRRPWIAVIALMGLVGIWFVVRTAVLATARTGMLLELKDPLQLLGDGLGMWLAGWGDYGSFLPRLKGGQVPVMAAGLILFAALAVAALRLRWEPGRRQLLLAGLALLLVPALLQWPIIGFQNLRIGASSSPVELVVNARYFYVALAGAVLVAAALLTPICQHSRIARRATTLALLLVLVPWLLASQRLAHSYRNETRQQRDLAVAAIQAIETTTIPTDRCQIYLLDTGNWMFGWISDQAIKAVVSDLRRIEHCLIQTEHTPWYHVVVTDWQNRADLLPMTTMPGDARAQDPPWIGRARIVSLNLSPRSDASTISAAVFLAWREGRFVDISADVSKGLIKPTFDCNRRADQCPP